MHYKESYNHVIGTKSVPGSTFKLASLMALLEDNKLGISDIVHAKGSYTFFGNTLNDSKRGGYGMITVEQAFEKSSNVFSKMVYDAYKNDPNQFSILSFLRTTILPLIIVTLFGLALLAVTARIWLPGDMLAPAPVGWSQNAHCG